MAQQSVVKKVHNKLLADGVRLDPRWRDYDTFKTEAGQPPERAVRVEPMDTRRPIGIVNFRWVTEPKMPPKAAA
jgi:hypothetical protein